jgi:hypothetical protein
VSILQCRKTLSNMQGHFGYLIAVCYSQFI